MSNSASNVAHDDALTVLQAVLESTSDAVCLVGEDRELKLYNRAYEEILARAGVLDPQNQGTPARLTDDVLRASSAAFEEGERASERLIAWFHSHGAYEDTVRLRDGRVFHRRSRYIPGLGRLFITQNITDHVYQERRYETLLHINNALVLNLDKDTLFRSVAAEIHRVTAVDRAGITLYDPNGNRFQIFVLETKSTTLHLTKEMEIPYAGSAMGWAIEHRTPCIRHDLSTQHEFFEDDFFSQEGLRSVVTIPMTVDDVIVGTLNVASREPHHFSDPHLAFLRDVAHQVAIAFRNAERFQAVEDAKTKLHHQAQYLRQEIEERGHFEGIIGESRPLKAMLKQVNLVAPTEATVLILGETGTGKELVARAIHAASRRKEGPLVTVNCGALPTGLLESELFGHERGAFTGALYRKIGRFEVAQQGTIFLDEIGELPLDLQAKLLRVVEHQTFERLGSTETRRVDVRIIAATHRDLEQAVRNGTFREDLFYRLNVFPIHVPPLRERQDDIPLLARYFASRFAKSMNKHFDAIHPHTMEQLRHYHWPGNVREMLHVIERASILCQGPALELAGVLATTGGSPSGAPKDQSSKTLEQIERDHILKTLEQTAWRIGGDTGAAQMLGLHPNTLRSRMVKLGIKRPT